MDTEELLQRLSQVVRKLTIEAIYIKGIKYVVSAVIGPEVEYRFVDSKLRKAVKGLIAKLRYLKIIRFNKASNTFYTV
jgi:hypothetical protein